MNGFIYKWIDSTNNKTYVGSHLGTPDDGYIGSGAFFKAAYKKRPESFTREILEYVSKDVLLEVEQCYLDKIDWDNTYNLASTAGPKFAGGTKQSAEHIRKRSKAIKGRKHSENHKQKISKRLKGKKKKPFTKEHKQNISDSHKGEKHHFYGIPITEERRKNISESKKGKKLTEEHKQNISDGKKRKPLSARIVQERKKNG